MDAADARRGSPIARIARFSNSARARSRRFRSGCVAFSGEPHSLWMGSQSVSHVSRDSFWNSAFPSRRITGKVFDLENARKVARKRKRIRPPMATSEQAQTLADYETRSDSGRRRKVRKRRRRSSSTPEAAGSAGVSSGGKIAGNEPLEVVSCEQRSVRIVHRALQIAAVFAALGVAYLSYRGIRSGSGGAWVGVLGLLALLSIAMFSLKKMKEPSDWDPEHFRTHGERRRRRRRSRQSRSAGR